MKARFQGLGVGVKSDMNNLKENGISRIGKDINYFIKDQHHDSYSHYMDSNCVKLLNEKLEEYRKAPIRWVEDSTGVKFPK